MDQFFNKVDEDKPKCDTNKNKNQCDVENSVTSNTRTDLWSRVKRLEYWSEKYKVHVDCKRNDETLLLMCLRLQHSDSCIMHLIKIECDVNTPDRYGNSPLHLAIQRSTLIVAIQLIERGANINAQDNQKETPLHYAVSKSHEAVCMLLCYGADVYVKCCYMESPLSIAFSSTKSEASDTIQTLMNYHEEKDLYEEINTFIYKNTILEGFVLSKDSRLFKLLWTYISHDGLRELYNPFLLTYLYECNFPTNEWLECLQLILQSDSIVDLIEHFNNDSNLEMTFVSSLLPTLYNKEIEVSKRTNIIFTVLSLGSKICPEDFNRVFECFGFSTELKAFIYAADYDAVYNSELFSFALLPFILALNDDFSTKTIVSLLKKQIMCDDYVTNRTKQSHIASALRYFSFNANSKAELSEICCQHVSNNCQIKRVLNEVPEFPSLLELSRNRIYLSIRNSYKVKRSYHFHDAVNNLLLPQQLKDVIIFKRPIY